MTATATIQTSFIAAEDFQVGRRYIAVRPGCESNWTVAKVEMFTSQCEVYRNGKWVSPELVKVTYRDGRTLQFEKGEQVWIHGVFTD